MGKHCSTWLTITMTMTMTITITMTINTVCLGRPMNANKVSLDLYYESLCPYSATFIIHGLAPIFDNGGIIDIVDLSLYPWGNTNIRPDSSYACQHGLSDCLLNTVHACAIDAKPALTDHFPFIECVERLVHDHKHTQWETCFENSNFDPQSVKECTFGQRGKELALKYATATASLKPPREYVPWVVVDGEPLYEDYENFTNYVCKAYKGTLPSACTGESSGNFTREKTTPHSSPVCYADKLVPQTILPLVLSDQEAI
ncbi:hypothetical protein RND81_14G012000 [Saponaria officinalis]|uniref:Gamma-interferon-inducible lysosomal thiol reductase n=1 Tax=Saponaria officinalis TaxID=3572 RepID=A0AAW1GGC0_SAPOF